MIDPRPEWVEEVRRVLADNGANSERGWHSRFCFDRDGYAECDCTEAVARLALTAVIDQIKAETLREVGDWLKLGKSERDLLAAQACYDRADRIAGAES